MVSKVEFKDKAPLVNTQVLNRKEFYNCDTCISNPWEIVKACKYLNVNKKSKNWLCKQLK